MKQRTILALACGCLAALFSVTSRADGATVVAQVGDVAYDSLQKAVSAAQAGETVTMLADTTITAPVAVASGQTVVLDLNGKAISGAVDNAITIAVGASLTVNDSGTGGSIRTDKNYSNGLQNEGTLVVNGGTFEAYYGALRLIGGSTTTVNGGTFRSSTARYGMYYYYLFNKQPLKVTVNGGTFDAVDTGVNGITLEVYGGSFKSDLSQFCPEKGGATYETVKDETTGLYVYTMVSAPSTYVENANGNVTILDAGALRWFAKVVEKGTTFAKKTVTLAADIDLSNSEWTPIGGKFSGTFDGARHTIRGVKEYSERYGFTMGFFGTLTSATVKNVTFEDLSIENVNLNVMGGVAAYAYGNCTFRNVHIKNAKVIGYAKVGGIVGLAADPGSYTTFANCSIENSALTGEHNVAGLCGLSLGTVSTEGSWVNGVTHTFFANDGSFAGVVQVDDIVVCDGSVKTCLGKGAAVVGEYRPDLQGGVYYAYSAWSDFYNSYGDASHDCELENTSAYLIANSELVHNAVAQVGEKTYANLADAFAAVHSGGTIMLLSDVILAGPSGTLYNLEDGVTIDLNGHDIDGESVGQNVANPAALGLNVEVQGSTGVITIANSAETPSVISGLVPLLVSSYYGDPLEVRIGEGVELSAAEGGAGNCVKLDSNVYIVRTTRSENYFTNGGFAAVVDGEARIYEDFASAADYADETTAVLLNNYTGDQSVKVKKNGRGNTAFTLDLDGKTYTYTGYNGYGIVDLDCAKSLTVKHGRLVNTSAGLQAGIKLETSGASVTLDSVEVEVAGSYGLATSGTDKNCTITLVNATIHASNGVGIYFPSTGTLTIEGGEIAAQTGVQICAGTLTIKGEPTITATGTGTPTIGKDGGILDGAAVSVISRTGYGSLGSVQIAGGSFISAAGVEPLQAYGVDGTSKVDWSESADVVTVSGGRFSAAIDSIYCASGYELVEDADGLFVVRERIADGTREHPYSRQEFAAMTRDAYSAAQERLGGTMYVEIGDYVYEANGVLGNGVRVDENGNGNLSTQLNYYGAPGAKEGANSDAAVGKAVVFLGGSVTSGATGYKDINNIGTSLLLAVPAYTSVRFENVTFNNVLNFDYQIYTSPWSQLAQLEFKDCTFNGLIVGSLATMALSFNGCSFTDYLNTIAANNSNPIWIRPAYGNGSAADNKSQGADFRSLGDILFTANFVTSTRPVKFEDLSKWFGNSAVAVSGNAFDIHPQTGDTAPRNVGMYIGTKAKLQLVAEQNTKSSETAALFTTVYSSPDGQKYNELPAGSTVTDAHGMKTEVTDALVWKAEEPIVLKTMPVVAAVSCSAYKMSYPTFAQAYASINRQTTADMTLYSSAHEPDVPFVVADGKDWTIDLGGHDLTVGRVANAGSLTILSNGDGMLTADEVVNTGTMDLANCLLESSLTSSGTLMLEDVDVSKADGVGITVTAGEAFLDGVSGASAQVLLVQGGEVSVNNSYLAGTSTTDATIRATAGLLSIIGETFIAADESSPFLACEGATVYLLDGKFTGDISVAEGATAPVITGGRFRKNFQAYCAEGYMMKTEGDWYGVVISSDVLTPVEGSREVESEAIADALVASGVGLTTAVGTALPTDAAKAAYRSLFTMKKVQSADGKWVVSCELTDAAKATLQAQVDSADLQQAVVKALSTGSRATLTGVTPGLYYSVLAGTTPTDITREVARFLANADGTLEMPIPKPGVEGNAEQTAPAGFYRLCVSVTPKVD